MVGQPAPKVRSVRYEGWRPGGLGDVPAGAVAIEPAERQTMTARQAQRYVEAFNRAVENSPRKIWAVALPVTIRYDGDPQPGELLVRHK